MDTMDTLSFKTEKLLVSRS